MHAFPSACMSGRNPASWQCRRRCCRGPFRWSHPCAGSWSRGPVPIQGSGGTIISSVNLAWQRLMFGAPARDREGGSSGAVPEPVEGGGAWQPVGEGAAPLGEVRTEGDSGPCSQRSATRSGRWPDTGVWQKPDRKHRTKVGESSWISASFFFPIWAVPSILKDGSANRLRHSLRWTVPGPGPSVLVAGGGGRRRPAVVGSGFRSFCPLEEDHG